MASQPVFEETPVAGLMEVKYQPKIESAPSALRVRWIFWGFLLIYLCTWSGHYSSSDGAQKIQWAKQMIAGGPYWVDTVTGLPPRYGIGHSLIAIPSLVAAKTLRAMTGIHAEGPLYTLIFIVNGAFLLYLIGRYLRRKGYSIRSAWIVACVVGLATSWWPYTKLDASESLVATCILGGIVLFTEERVVLGLLCASFAVLLRSDAVLLLAVLLAWEIKRRDFHVPVRAFLLGLTPGALVYAAVNLSRFHSVFDHGYPGEHFSTPLYVGVYGILFSAGKSVFLFSPGLVLGFLGWQRFKEKFPNDALLFGSAFVVQLLLYARWWDWSGDDGWGVRFMLPSVILMTIPCVEMCRRRGLMAFALAVGLLVEMPAVLMSPLEYVVMVHNLPLSRKAVYVAGRNRVDFDDVRFNPRYSELAAGYELLRERLGATPAPTPADLEGSSGTPMADVLRQGPAETGCRWDLIWCRLGSAGRRGAPNEVGSPPLMGKN